MWVPCTSGWRHLRGLVRLRWRLRLRLNSKNAGARGPRASWRAELSALSCPGRSEDLGKAMPPAWMGRAPAEFPLGLGVGGAAALGRHHHRSLSGEDPGQHAWEAT